MAPPRSRRIGPALAIDLPPLTPFAGAPLEEHGDYSGLDFVDLDLGGGASGASFEACRFERCQVDRLALPRARLTTCLLRELRGTTLEVGDSTWREVLVTEPRVGALLAARATWTSVRVRGGKLDFVDLTAARLTDVAFDACVIGELTLDQAQLRSVRFDGCRVDVLDVGGARVTDVDLSGASLGLVRGLGGLRGAVIGAPQLVELAPQLAAHLGIVVRED